MPTHRWDKRYIFLLLLLAALGLLMHIRYWLATDSLRGQDIYFTWLEGKRIIAGENPYARVLTGDMRTNAKYATYFPVTYIFSALVQKLGLTSFRDWLNLWRPISFGFHIGIVSLILRYYEKRSLWILGFVASSIILLGRWSLYVIRVQHLEFAAIFFLLLSLILLEEKPRLSLLMLSISLGIKQVAILLLPLYLIHLWSKGENNHRARNLVIALVIALSIPLVTSLPFLIWGPEGFFKSILFSATRFGGSHIGSVPSIDVIFSKRYEWIVGIKAKLPMLILMAMVYASYFKEKVGIFTACTMTMVTFWCFNSVLLLQYFLWPLCILPFALIEFMPLSSRQRQE